MCIISFLVAIVEIGGQDDVSMLLSSNRSYHISLDNIDKCINISRYI